MTITSWIIVVNKKNGKLLSCSLKILITVIAKQFIEVTHNSSFHEFVDYICISKFWLIVVEHSACWCDSRS